MQPYLVPFLDLIRTLPSSPILSWADKYFAATDDSLLPANPTASLLAPRAVQLTIARAICVRHTSPLPGCQHMAGHESSGTTQQTTWWQPSSLMVAKHTVSSSWRRTGSKFHCLHLPAPSVWARRCVTGYWHESSWDNFAVGRWLASAQAVSCPTEYTGTIWQPYALVW